MNNTYTTRDHREECDAVTRCGHRITCRVDHRLMATVREARATALAWASPTAPAPARIPTATDWLRHGGTRSW